MIRLENVSKSYGTFTAVSRVNVSIDRGEVYGIIGASGAGKSTVLRLMNQLEIPDEGKVFVNDEDLTELSKRKLRASRKGIGMIFQHFNLVANKSVYENVAIALKLARVSKEAERSRVEEYLAFVGLTEQREKYPAQLSGGQKQRVAIARALANQPDVLLCDEPTSSLDPHTTKEILGVLENINQTLGVTVVIVSHEMDVIKSVCDRVSVMSEGAIYKTIPIVKTGIQASDRSPERFVEELTDDA
ncbi:methionine ABC transporter ATP-binding protein [Geomicrobium sp. JSM 1781026]